MHVHRQETGLQKFFFRNCDFHTTVSKKFKGKKEEKKHPVSYSSLGAIALLIEEARGNDQTGFNR